MLNKVLKFYKPPADQDVVISKTEVATKYKHWRWRMFYGMFIAYIVMYMCRVNISIALPEIQKDLNYSNMELGFIGTALYITYAVGKFVNGVLADKANVRTFLTTAVFGTAVINIFVGTVSNGLYLMVLLWGMNGWFQSMAFPPIAKGLTHWFSQKERATKWSIWSTAHQVGTYLATVLSGFMIAYLGWRFTFIVPGIIAIIVGIFIYDRVRDTPKSIGLPSIEEFKNEPVLNEEEGKEIVKEGYVQTFIRHILPNKVLWLLAITYIFVYIVRYGTQDWVFKFLLENRPYGKLQAAQIFSFLPLCGIVGSVAAGYFSDKFFKGRRMPINMTFMMGVGFCMWLLLLNAQGSFWIDILLISMIGIFIYGPQVLVGGVCAVEAGSKKVASAATGFTGMFGYIGASIVGPVTGYLLDVASWNEAFYFWIGCAVTGGIICLLMIRNEDKRLGGLAKE